MIGNKITFFRLTFVECAVRHGLKSEINETKEKMNIILTLEIFMKIFLDLKSNIGQWTARQHDHLNVFHLEVTFFFVIHKSPEGNKNVS